MRVKAVVVLAALAGIGLFAIAVLIGYVGGRAFLAPTASAPRQLVRPVPRLTPPPPSVPAQQEPVRPVPKPEPAPPASEPVPQPAPEPAPKPSPPQQTAPRSAVIYRVQVGAFLRRENAEARAEQLRQDGFDAYINQSGGLFKVQVGAFSDRDNAFQVAQELRAKGYEVLITP